MSKPDWRRPYHVLAAVFLAAMAIIAFVNILGRYLFHYSLAFTEEVTINLFVWMTLIGSGIAFERGAHMGMESLYDLFPRRLRRAVTIAGALLAAALFAAVDILLVKTIHTEITLFKATSPSLGIPVWIYYAGAVACSPAVFIGVYRGAAKRLPNRENGLAECPPPNAVDTAAEHYSSSSTR